MRSLPSIFSLRKALLLLLLPLAGAAQSLPQKMAAAWEKFANNPQLTYSAISITVVNTQTGEEVFSRNEMTGLAPASTLKTVTSATALYLLGPGFTYTTPLTYSGNIDENGTLNGDLVIKGSGDPTLGSDRYPGSTERDVLKEWFDAVKTAGIRKITGRVIGDDRLFGTQTTPDGWIWEDIGNYYGAGPSALTWRENTFYLQFKPGNKPGEPTRLTGTTPPMPFLNLVNEVTTGAPGSGDGTIVYSSPYSGPAHVRGTYGIDLQKNIGAAVPNPALDAAYRLKELFTKNGIETGPAITPGEDRDLPSSTQKTLSLHASPPLKEIIYWLNQKSINLYAEDLLKTLAIKQGKEATTAAGAIAVQQFWNKKLGIDENALRMIDGSGLSPGTRVTTLAIARILSSVKKEAWFNDYFASFPVINNIKMKSGSIENVQAYAGYLPNADAPLAFSLIVNNYSGSTAAIKQKMFELLDQLK